MLIKDAILRFVPNLFMAILLMQLFKTVTEYIKNQTKCFSSSSSSSSETVSSFNKHLSKLRGTPNSETDQKNR